MKTEQMNGWSVKVIIPALLTGVILLMAWNLSATHNDAVTTAAMNQKIADRLDGIDRRLDGLSLIRWTVAHQQVWADRLRTANTNLTVPDVSEVKKLFEPTP